jgi:murein DD-endopeptidase MepM/ murein hydrolase activator NlpD
MKKKFAAVLVLLMGFVLVFKPYDGHALSESEKIDRELKKLKEQMEQLAHNQKYADNTVKNLKGQKEATKEDITKLLDRIEMVQQRLRTTQSKVDTAEDQLYATGEQLTLTTQQLDQSIKQLENREKMLDSRVRLAYTTGVTTYLDVLLSAKSFSDFLNRLDAVESIVKQDSDIAEQKRAYSADVKDKKHQVEVKKQQIETDLQEIKSLYAEIADHKSELESNEQAKEEMVSKLSSQIEEMEEISEESEKQLTALAKKAAELEEKKNHIKNYYTGGKLGMPLKTEWRLSSPFGYRIHPITGKKKLHAGMDMAAPKGTSVYAAESGVVIVAQTWSGYGNCIIIDHGGGLWTLYGHLMNGGILVSRGETVKRGQKIGRVGSTGQSTGNHLHFEVRKNSEPVNPAPYLK